MDIPSDSSLSRAGAFEREANTRIAQAGKQVEAAQKQAEEGVNQIRDGYERQISSLNARQSQEFEKQKIKGYEQIRDLQRGQQAELRKLRREGESDLSKLNEHYHHTLAHTEKQSKEVLDDMQAKNSRRMQYEKSIAESELQEKQGQHQQQMELLRHNSEEQTKNLTRSTQQRFDELRTNYEEATQRTQENFDQQFKQFHTQSAESLNQIQNRASHLINEIRQNTSEKLSAYQTRQNDPFYKLLNINARLRDEGDAYVLTAIVPEYEQQHLSTMVKGNNIVITGNRRNEETIEIEPGHTRGSSSFQSFHESFPLAWPVNVNELTRETHGDLVIIRIPKKNEYAFKTPDARKSEKPKAEPPHFPKNLPRTQHAEKPQEIEPEDSTQKKRSNTLL